MDHTSSRTARTRVRPCALPAAAWACFALCLLLSAHPASAAAAGNPARAHEQGTDFSPEECPAIFGTSERRAANALFREQHLNHVMGASGSYTVVHHNPRWDKPSPLRIQGIHLVEAGRGGDKRAFVRVNLDAPTASRVSCEPGIYRLTRDDNIAPGASILAILDRSLLISRHGRLTYIPAIPGSSQNFRMVWQSPWTIEIQSESSGTAPGPRQQQRPARQQQRQPRRR